MLTIDMFVFPGSKIQLLLIKLKNEEPLEQSHSVAFSLSLSPHEKNSSY